MIKVENVVLPSPEQWKAIIFGARNPLNSWDKSDSHPCAITEQLTKENYGYRCAGCKNEFIGRPNCVVIGPNDHELMMKLAKAGTDHRKFMRMIDVYLDITAPLYWWKEFKTYRKDRKFLDNEDFYDYDDYEIEEFIEMNSCSTMHKIHSKEFTLEDFSCEHLGPPAIQNLKSTIKCMNDYREEFLKDKDKHNWWQMIQLLPSSYNQKRTVKLNYEVLLRMYKSRRGHKLDEWQDFCKWIESLPYSELITGEEKK